MDDKKKRGRPAKYEILGPQTGQERQKNYRDRKKAMDAAVKGALEILWHRADKATRELCLKAWPEVKEIFAEDIKAKS